MASTLRFILKSHICRFFSTSSVRLVMRHCEKLELSVVCFLQLCSVSAASLGTHCNVLLKKNAEAEERRDSVVAYNYDQGKVSGIRNSLTNQSCLVVT